MLIAARQRVDEADALNIPIGKALCEKGVE
jgi:hypothetical protein